MNPRKLNLMIYCDKRFSHIPITHRPAAFSRNIVERSLNINGHSNLMPTLSKSNVQGGQSPKLLTKLSFVSPPEVTVLWNTVVTGQGIGKKNVFLLCARADVVDGKRNARRRLPVADNHYVRKLSADHCRHDIAGLVVRRIPGHGQRIPFPLEIALQVRNAPVVDVRVRSLESPYLWIL